MLIYEFPSRTCIPHVAGLYDAPCMYWHCIQYERSERLAARASVRAVRRGPLVSSPTVQMLHRCALYVLALNTVMWHERSEWPAAHALVRPVRGGPLVCSRTVQMLHRCALYVLALNTVMWQERPESPAARASVRAARRGPRVSSCTVQMLHRCQKIGAVGLNSPVMGAPWSGLASLPGPRLSHPDSPVV